MKRLRKANRVTRYISYWSYFLTSIGVPIILIGSQFDLIKKPSVSVYGIIAILMFTFFMRKEIKKSLADMEQSKLKTIFENIMRLFPLILMWVVLRFMETHIIKVRFILFWSTISLGVSVLFDVWHTSTLIKIKQERDNK